MMSAQLFYKTTLLVVNLVGGAMASRITQEKTTL
jgi:hypothetical protein